MKRFFTFAMSLLTIVNMFAYKTISIPKGDWMVGTTIQMDYPIVGGILDTRKPGILLKITKLPKDGGYGELAISKGTDVIWQNQQPVTDENGFTTFTPTPCIDAYYVISEYGTDNGDAFIITSVEANAFKGDNKLQQLTFDYDMASIPNILLGESAFEDCTAFTGLYLRNDSKGPEQLNKFETVKKRVFANTALQGNIYCIDKVGESAFQGTEISKFEVLPNKYGAYYGSVDANAFANCKKLTRVKIGDQGSSKPHIDKTAFSGCTALAVVEWMGNEIDYSWSADESPFYAVRSSLKSVYTHGNIPRYLFAGCNQLTEFRFVDDMDPTSPITARIYPHAFKNCTSLTTIEVGGVIDPTAFEGCTALKKIIWRGYYNNYKSSYNPTVSPFQPVASQITSFTFKANTLIAKNKVRIPAHLCKDMQITSIQLPENIDPHFGEGAFENCTKLKTVTFPSDVEQSMTGFEFGKDCFRNCVELSSINLPYGTTVIGENCFLGCTSLADFPITENHIQLEEIGNHAFYQTSITSIYVPESVKTVYAPLAGGSGVSTVQKIRLEVPLSTLTKETSTEERDLLIEGYDDRKAVKTVWLASKETSLPNQLFAKYEALENVWGLGNVTSIGNHAFYECKKLARIYAPKLKTIGDNAFALSGMKEIFNSADWNNVESVGLNAFYSCPVEVVGQFAESLKTIGNDAFANCEKLKEIYLPPLLQSKPANIFTDCPNITKLVYATTNCNLVDPLGKTIRQNISQVTIKSSVEHIPNNFLQESKIEELILPKEVTSIGANAFQNCDNLRNVSVHSNLTTSATSEIEAPFMLSGVQNIYFASTVTAVPQLLFDQCQSLKKISWGGVKSIGERAFMGCTGLTELTFSNLESIAEKSFCYNTALETIYINGTVPTLATNSFESCNIKKIQASCNNYAQVSASADWKAVCSNINQSDNIYSQYDDENDYLNYIDVYAIGVDVSYSDRHEYVNRTPVSCEGVFTLTATEKNGYKFAYWMQDGNTDNPRTVNMNTERWYGGYDAIYYNDESNVRLDVSAYPANAATITTINDWGVERQNGEYLSMNESPYIKLDIAEGWVLDTIEFMFSKETEEAHYYDCSIYDEATGELVYGCWKDNLSLLEYEEVTRPGDIFISGYRLNGFDTYINQYGNALIVFKFRSLTPQEEYKVIFQDWNGTVLSNQTVKEGENATKPADPKRENHKFTGWDKNFTNVTSNLLVTAQYERTHCTVIFLDWDETVLDKQTVEVNKSATAPADPVREGFRFTGWDKPFTKVTDDLTVTALYEEIMDDLEEIWQDMPTENPVKVLLEGNIYIVCPDGRMYNMHGMRVR